MSQFNVPAGMSLQSLEKDSVTLTVDADHTVGKPHIVIIDRRVPTVSGNGTFSQPRYRIRVIQGNLDAEGMPVQARTLADLEMQWRVDNEPSWVSSQILDPLLAVLGTVDFETKVFGSQMLPTYCTESEV